MTLPGNGPDGLSGGRLWPLAGGALFIGVLSSAIGIGGGALFVPLLERLFRLDFKTAAGTSLAIIIPLSLAGGGVHLLHTQVPVVPVGLFILASVGGSSACSLFYRRIETGWLRLLFALLLVATAVRLAVGGTVGADGPRLAIDVLSWQTLAALAGAGLLTGMLSTLLGVGGGVVIVPLFTIGFGLPMHAAVAVSMVVIVATAVSGVVVHLRSGTLHVRSARVMIVPAMVGAGIGALIANRLPARALQIGFALFLTAMAFRYAAEAWADAGRRHRKIG